MTKKQRSVASTSPRYPREPVGRRRFLRELGIGAAAMAALPLAGCVQDNDASGTPRMPDARGERLSPDGGVAPSPDAPVDISHVVDGFPYQPDAAIDARRPDGGIPDGAGADGQGVD